MTANHSPIFIRQVRTNSIILQNAAPAIDGTGSTLLLNAGPDGSRIQAITGVFSDTVTTQTVLRLFKAVGSAYTIIGEVQLPIFTRAAGVPSEVIDLMDFPFIDPSDRFFTLGAGESIWCALLDTIESAIHITLWAGDY